MRSKFIKKINNYKRQKRNIVYIDESGFSINKIRDYGYALVGKRCYDKYNWGNKGRINTIGALVENKLITASLFETSINSDIFYNWCEQDLIPILPSKSIIVMDNATFHKRKDIQELIHHSKHKLEYLPPYSPDLNPIEHKWAQLKSIRRKFALNVDELFKSYF